MDTTVSSEGALEAGWRAAEDALRMIEDNARRYRAEIRRLKRAALAGDDQTARLLSVLLPGNYRAYRMAGVRLPYTGALLARDLAERGRGAMARRALVDAWSHCHLTTIRALARQPWDRPLKFRHLTPAVDLFRWLRPFDPHIPDLPEMLTLWRGEGVANRGAGMSWTFDRDRARFFVERYWPARGRDEGGIVYQVTVRREDVLAIVGNEDGRDEREAVLSPVEAIKAASDAATWS